MIFFLFFYNFLFFETRLYFVITVLYDNLTVILSSFIFLMDDYKEDEETEIITSKDIENKDLTIQNHVNELIEKCASLFSLNQNQDLISLLNELYQYCERYFSKSEQLSLDFKTNIEVLLSFLNPEDPEICCLTLKILIQFAKSYESNVKDIIDNSLILFPIHLFENHENISYPLTLILIKSMISGFSIIVHENEIEQEPFNLNWLIHDDDNECEDEDEEEEEDFDMDQYLIKCLELLLKLSEHRWSMNIDSVDDIFSFITMIFNHFYEEGLKNGYGDQACNVIIQLCTSLVNNDPNNVQSIFIINTCCKILDFYFFMDDPKEFNMTFSSLLLFFINCAQKVPEEICREIYQNVDLSDLLDYYGEKSNQLISGNTSLLINYYIHLLPEKCAERIEDIKIIAENQLFLLSESKLLTKKIASHFFLVLYQNSNIFSDICQYLVVEKDLLGILHGLIEVEDDKLSKTSLATVVTIARNFPESHEMILNEFHEIIDEDELDPLKNAIEDVLPKE